MTISTTLWFVYRGMIYCGICGLLLTFIPHFRLHKRALQLYWLTNLLVIGTWYLSQFSAQNWLVVSTPLRWLIALWLNANMAYVALGMSFLIASLLFRLFRRKPNSLFWRKPNRLLIPIVSLLSAFGVYEAMSSPLLRHYEVSLEQLPPALEGMKIAQITDSHIGDFVGSDDLTHVVDRLNTEKPDLLVMTGDLLDDERQLDGAFAALARSNAPLGVIAILGNHEKYHADTVKLNIQHSYSNMLEVIEKNEYVVAIAKKAIKNVGLEPVSRPVRGGTDGARLSFMGLPCPNLGTGGYGFHGPFEHISVEGMDTAVSVIKEIVKITAE
jgi:hypothetical protein